MWAAAITTPQATEKSTTRTTETETKKTTEKETAATEKTTKAMSDHGRHQNHRKGKTGTTTETGVVDELGDDILNGAEDVGDGIIDGAEVWEMILWSRATEPELAAEPQETARERRVPEWQETDQRGKRSFRERDESSFPISENRAILSKKAQE